MNNLTNHPLYRIHNLDSAMNGIWDFYKQKFIPLFFISLAMSLVIQYISTSINIKELQNITDPMIMLEALKGYMVPILIISLVNLLFTTIMQYYILFNPVSTEYNFLNSLLKSLKYFIPYLIIMVLLAFAGSIAILLGLLVLVVGVFFSLLYVMTIYLFILPVMMAEETNIGNTITRTLSLAHRNFWSNIGWVAVFLIILIVVSVILSGIILIPFTGGFIKTLVNPQEATELVDFTTKPLFIILSALVSAITMPLMPILSCVLYFNGRAREEENKNVPLYNIEDEKVKVEDLYAKPYADDHPDNPEKNA